MNLRLQRFRNRLKDFRQVYDTDEENKWCYSLISVDVISFFRPALESVLRVIKRLRTCCFTKML